MVSECLPWVKHKKDMWDAGPQRSVSYCSEAQKCTIYEGRQTGNLPAVTQGQMHQVFCQVTSCGRDGIPNQIYTDIRREKERGELF